MSNCRWVVIAEDCYEELKDRSSSTTANKSKTPDKKEAIPESRSESSQDWTAALPPSYRSKAQEFLDKLFTFNDFTISPSGHITFNGKVTNYHIEQLLRTAFIPHNNTTFPIDIQEWLREKGINQFLNPLAVIRPKWESAFTLRRSSRISRAAQSRPYTSKRGKTGGQK